MLLYDIYIGKCIQDKHVFMITTQLYSYVANQAIGEQAILERFSWGLALFQNVRKH